MISYSPLKTGFGFYEADAKHLCGNVEYFIGGPNGGNNSGHFINNQIADDISVMFIDKSFVSMSGSNSDATNITPGTP